MISPVIFWFRQDLRLSDLPALAAAAATGQPVLPCYILDDSSPGHWRIGAASRWWLHHSIAALSDELSTLGTSLILRRGDPQKVLTTLMSQTGATAIYCSRLYEPWAGALETQLHRHFAQMGIAFKRYGGGLLFEPETVSNRSGGPYKIFTPFWRHCLAAPQPAPPQPLAADTLWHDARLRSDALTEWSLTPRSPNWAKNWDTLWQPGSAGALQTLQRFLRESLTTYSDGRNSPALLTTSFLSPHLHFGELSPRTVCHHAQRLLEDTPLLQPEISAFLRQLGWRDFSHHLLHHFPHLCDQPFKPPFAHFPWRDDTTLLTAWQRGMTGYPLVDAGMRELWQTGFMHNRVRMITASFLTKHLLIHWRRGADWFWNTLLDADLANNSCGWQWVAGSGADASPFFRIFNPVAQGEKFDRSGHYVKRWVPELSSLPARYIHSPWLAPADVLTASGLVLGQTYPHPIIDHADARKAALAAFSSLTS